MTPIAKAIAQLGGPTAAGRLFDIVYQTPQQWIAQGRVPAEYCPRIEQLTGIRCEELNDRVDWSLIRSINHGAKVRAAISDARHVFEGDKVAEDVLHYIEQVLAAGAPVPAQTGITPGAEDASIAKEAHTPLGSVPTVVAGSEWPAWARDLDKVTADVGRIAGYAGDVFRELANILGTVGADTFEQAAAAMAAESVEKVADAERSVAARAGTVISKLVVEVDTTQLDAALAKAGQLKLMLNNFGCKQC